MFTIYIGIVVLRLAKFGEFFASVVISPIASLLVIFILFVLIQLCKVYNIVRVCLVIEIPRTLCAPDIFVIIMMTLLTVFCNQFLLMLSDLFPTISHMFFIRGADGMSFTRVTPMTNVKSTTIEWTKCSQFSTPRAFYIFY